MTNVHIDSVSSSETETKIRVSKDGHITFGIKRFRSHAGTIRRQIIELIASNANGHLLKRDYERELVSGHFIQSPNRELRLVSEPYMKRQNNVEKALSRLRQDLANFFQEDFPAGTVWLCFSKKIDGWLLYRLPGLGCDGEYHW
jgi:hypothetical protein